MSGSADAYPARGSPGALNDKSNGWRRKAIAHRDRIARIGFQPVEWIVESHDRASGSQRCGSQPQSGVHGRWFAVLHESSNGPDFATAGTKPKRIRPHSMTEPRPILMGAVAASSWRSKQLAT